MSEIQIKPELLTKTALKQRGWNDRLIEELLPEPIVRRNPYNAGFRMYLYRTEEVEKQEKSEAFNAYRKKREERAERIEKAIRTKQRRMEEYTEEKIQKIRVGKYSLEFMRKFARDEKFYWNMNHGSELFTEPDEETMERWMVNSIRHNFTEYDEFLYEGKGKTGFPAASQRYREAVLRRIAETYPALKEECERQIRRRRDISSLCGVIRDV